MKTYEDLRGRPADFIVHYRLYTQEEVGRKVTFQHLRCDFAYKGDEIEKTGIYMIHPQFLDGSGNAIISNLPVALTGSASMWIMSDTVRQDIHRHRVAVGVQGYFMEGRRKTGEATVTQIVGLHRGF